MTTSSVPVPASDPEPPLALTARCPEDLIALVPVVMGFHPEDSVVMLTFGAQRSFHARVDLPPPTDDVARRRAELDELASALVAPAARAGVVAVVLVLYSDDPGRAGAAWRRLRRAFGDAGIRVVDALRVAEGRYHPYLARDRALRDRGIPFDVSAHPFLAEAVLDGRVVHGSRAEVVAAAEPDPVATERVAAEVDSALRGGGVPSRVPELLAAGTWVRALVERHVAAGTVPTDAEVARLLWTMQAVRVRDAAWELVRRRTARPHVDFWLGVVRRAPADLVAAPAALLGWAAWMAGDGALAWTGVDRSREADPAYGLAGLLAHALEHAFPPETGELDFDWAAGLRGR